MPGKNWIDNAIKKPGALRKTLRIKKGKEITEAALNKAEHSKSSLTAKRATLAKTLKSFNK